MAAAAELSDVIASTASAVSSMILVSDEWKILRSAGDAWRVFVAPSKQGP